jgi:hypothetical protein
MMNLMIFEKLNFTIKMCIYLILKSLNQYINHFLLFFGGLNTGFSRPKKSLFILVKIDDLGVN